MRKISFFFLLGFLSATFACNNSRPVEAASNGALPAVNVPIGPIPGPTKATDLPANPYHDNQIALYEGRKLFQQYNCSGCHGGHGGGGMGPSLRDKDWIYGSSDAHIFSSIAEGRAHGMPAWGTRIPDDQIWKLVTYIQSMRTPQEPEAPETSPQPKAVRKGF